MKIATKWNILATLSQNFPPAKITTFTICHLDESYDLILQMAICIFYMKSETKSQTYLGLGKQLNSNTGLWYPSLHLLTHLYAKMMP